MTRTVKINDIWKDNHGATVTVKGIEFNRVKFFRTGYDFPCVYPLGRFVKEFTFVSDGMSNNSRSEQK